jgi:hypothetical protein
MVLPGFHKAQGGYWLVGHYAAMGFLQPRTSTCRRAQTPLNREQTLAYPPKSLSIRSFSPVL